MTGRRQPDKILALNQWIKTYCGDHDDLYLDYFAAMVDDKGFLKKDPSEDGLHPNKAGYDIMASLAQSAIDKASRKKSGSGSPFEFSPPPNLLV
jgi:lysophospholipase L1-like esterase